MRWDEFLARFIIAQWENLGDRCIDEARKAWKHYAAYAHNPVNE